jgi:hypothetical protein
MWEILGEGHSLGQAAEIFAEAFGIPVEQASDDVSRVWGEWSTGLLAFCFQPTDKANVEVSIPAPGDGLEPLAFSADYSVFGKVIRLRLYDEDVGWDLTPRVEPFRITDDTDASDSGAPDTEIEVCAGDESFHIFVNGVPISCEEAVFATRVIVLEEMLKAFSPQHWAAVLHAGACGSRSHCVLFPGRRTPGKRFLGCREFAAHFSMPNPDEEPQPITEDLDRMLYDSPYRKPVVLLPSRPGSRALVLSRLPTN